MWVVRPGQGVGVCKGLLVTETPSPTQDAESCYLIRALLKFYLNTVFKNYQDKAADFRVRKSFSTLANNFIVIVSKLQPSVSGTNLGPNAHGK